MNVKPEIAGYEKTGCELETLLKFLALEWMSHIIWALGREETIRFGALRRALPGVISARVLSHRLKALELQGFVVRHEKDVLPRHVEYSLTERGRNLDAALRTNETLSKNLQHSRKTSQHHL